MATTHNIWVFAEKQGLLAELIGGANLLAEKTGGQVTAVCLGPRAHAENAASSSVQRVIWLGDLPEGRLVDDYVPTLAKLATGEIPDLLLIGSTRRGKAVAGRLAALLGVTVLTDVLEIWPEGESVQARHLIFGGGAVRIDQTAKRPVLATVNPGVFSAPPAADGREAQITEAAFIPPAWDVKLRERKTRPAASVNLNGARRVVCPGRGIARQEDLEMVTDLARLLRAEIGCTRPLAEGLGWLPRERYIGISGATLKSDLYLGVGVSGQVQHVIGMSGSRVVVAINTDSNAPIFSQADYGIVGDLYQVVPALIAALEARKSG
jgi:electron transfer flavoprotein alpha subunit